MLLWVPLPKNLPNLFDIVIDLSNAFVTIGIVPISAQVITWGIDTLLSIVQTIIESYGLPKFG